MLDFHSHLLPSVDDGSNDMQESLLMLSSMASQGVSKVAATPHFFAGVESVDSFVERRDAAYSSLVKNTFDGCPEIVPGAEIRYYNGIAHLEGLEKLTLQNTRFLLIEMPFQKWTEFSIREICDISNLGKYTVVLAHIERYLKYQSNIVIERLLQNGVLFQCNATFFISGFASRKAFKMLDKMQIHFIGSDCHNMTSRPPNLIKAIDKIAKKFGDGFADDFINYGNELFLDNTISKNI